MDGCQHPAGLSPLSPSSEAGQQRTCVFPFLYAPPSYPTVGNYCTVLARAQRGSMGKSSQKNPTAAVDHLMRQNPCAFEGAESLPVIACVLELSVPFLLCLRL